MSRFGGAFALSAYQEDEEELFEASSSISDSDDDEAQVPDLEALQVAPKTVRRLNSESLHDMSSLKKELPAKKGLSRYYDGKSQSFACMSEVRCLQDLPKKSPYKKIKSCKSSVDLDGKNQNQEEACPVPGTPSSKGMAAKPSGSSCANLMARSNSGTNMLYRPPAIPVNKSAYRQ